MAPGRLPAAAAAAAGLDRPRRSAQTRAPSARSPSSCGPSGPARARPSAGSRPARQLGPETSIDKVLVATAEQARVRPRRRRPRCGAWRCGDDPASRALACGVPLLAGGDHLRRQCRDPAQHHRPPAPRPRRRTGDGRRRARALRGCRPPRHGAPPAVRRWTPRSTTSAGATPWPRTGAPRSRCSSSARVRRSVTSSALDQLLAVGLGLDDQPATVLLPPLRTAPCPRAPGRRPLRRCAAWRRQRSTARTSSWSSPGPSTGTPPSRCRRPSSRARPVGGIDPTLGLLEVGGDVAWTGAEPARAGRLGGRGGPRAAGAGPRARRGGAGDAGAGPLARAGADPVRAARSPPSRRSAIGWPTAWWRSRRRPRSLAAAWDDPSPVNAAMAKASAGRAARTRRPALPAGAGGHRVHHRAPLSPLLTGGRSCSTSSSGRGPSSRPSSGPRCCASRTLPPALPL